MQNHGAIVSGAGIGLRRAHFDALRETDESIPWLEFCPENYLGYGGRPHRVLMELAERWPLIAHGIAMNIGSMAPLDDEYLRLLKSLLSRVNSAWFSDHLCWNGDANRRLHELLPLPFTREAVSHVARRIQTVKRQIDRPFLIENISYYAKMPAEMAETDFITEILEAADCGLLLDVNNVYVNSRNHGFDPRHWIAQLPLERVMQIHVAGHDDSRPVVIDTHGEDVRDEVWELLEFTLSLTGPVPVLIERDQNIPSLSELLQERNTAQRIIDRIPLRDEVGALGPRHSLVHARHLSHGLKSEPKVQRSGGADV